MIKPDERTLKALNNIQQYPDWKIIREWFNASTFSVLTSSITNESDVISRWLQGKAQNLLDIQSYLDNARATLERMDKAKEQRPGIV